MTLVVSKFSNEGPMLATVRHFLACPDPNLFGRLQSVGAHVVCVEPPCACRVLTLVGLIP